MTKLDKLKALMAAAMPGELRVERVHDLWVELRTGYGLQNRMVADCLSERDAKLHEAAVNSLPALIGAVEALQRSLNWLASYPGGGTMGKDGPYEQARAALAPFGENDEQKDTGRA